MAIAVEVALASGALTGPRPGRYGWEMYSGLPYVPRAWSISGPDATEIHLDGVFIHPRSEIDYVDLLRSRGCELFPADAVRIKLADARNESIPCH